MDDDCILSWAFVLPLSDLLESWRASELPLIYSMTLSRFALGLVSLLSRTEGFLLLSERGEKVAIGWTASRSLL